MILGVAHLGITVSNLEKALGFYRDILGCEYRFAGGPYTGIDREVNVPNAEIKTVNIRIGAMDVELIEYVNPKVRPQGLSAAAIGTAHFAIEVDDIYTEVEKLQKKGLKFNAPPVRIDAGERKGEIWVFFNDPDGCLLELVQKK